MMTKTERSGNRAVKNFRTRFEAEIAGKALDEAEIPYLIQSQEGWAHGPIGAGATLFVSNQLWEEARRILGISPEAENDTAT